jgi:hypothetical protein
MCDPYHNGETARRTPRECLAKCVTFQILPLFGVTGAGAKTGRMIDIGVIPRASTFAAAAPWNTS